MGRAGKPQTLLAAEQRLSLAYSITRRKVPRVADPEPSPGGFLIAAALTSAFPHDHTG